MRASERTEAGHRRYSEADVRRLYQVVALRSLGVPPARIARALEGDGFTLKDAVTAHLEAVDAELLHARRLRRRLERILEVLERSEDPSVEELTRIMEVMRMHETYYTPEQLAQLEAWPIEHHRPCALASLLDSAVHDQGGDERAATVAEPRGGVLVVPVDLDVG